MLTVQRLLPAQVTALATQVAGDLALPAAMLEEIVQRTEGVPLFVEEMARLLRTARLEREAAGAAGATGARPALTLPTTVQESVQVRLATLGPVVQTVAQVAAAWGRAVTEAQLQATVPYPRGSSTRRCSGS